MERGRPTKLTPEVGEKIIELLKRGNFRETACAAAGVTRETMRVWLRRGATGEQPYAEFSARMDEAESAGEARHVNTIEQHAANDWRASAFILSRRWAQRWQEQTTQHHEVSTEGAPPEAARLIREAFGEQAVPKEKTNAAGPDDAGNGSTGDLPPGSSSS